MDQYAFQNVKMGYRKLVLTKILNDPVHNENLEKTMTNANLKDVVFSLANCWASVSTLLIDKSWKNLLPNLIDSEVEEIQLASLINQLQNTNPMSNTEALLWVAESDDSLARNEILTGDEIIRTVTAEDDNEDNVTPVNPFKISHSEAVAALNTSLQWAEEKNFETQEILLLRRLRDRAFELKIGTAEQKNDVHSLTYAVITKLSLITDGIENCSAQEFTISRQRDILGREAEIERLVHFIQKIFSVPSFLIATAQFSACTSIFGAFIVDSKIYTQDYVVLNQLVVVFLSSSGGLLACLWAAGGISIEEDRFKDTFRRKTKQRFQLNYINKCSKYPDWDPPLHVVAKTEFIKFRIWAGHANLYTDILESIQLDNNISIKNIPSSSKFFILNENISNAEFEVYTDGSRIEDETGFAVCIFQENNNIENHLYKLKSHNSVFQAELAAIHCAANWAASKNVSINIHTDSLSSIAAIKSPAPDLLL
ncbi:hypothetical protein AVEN_1062-1 [Araneus ventricosus]|uniref:Uncharacterized protein n=1 Tax=Araneus ventricosus TaxID=182803 RepID=A0A4Y2WSS8_ARAVE|nr:hypothetical protein AVEN_1062-1 [Araneus ventricosus]